MASFVVVVVLVVVVAVVGFIFVSRKFGLFLALFPVPRKKRQEENEKERR